MNDGLERCPADTDPDKLVDLLRRDGAVVVEELLDPAQVASINEEIEPHVAHRAPGFHHSPDDVFYGSNTKRVQGLAWKSPTFVDSILLNPTLLDVADRLLLSSCGNYWMSQAETIYIGPGNEAQELHRDDLNWGPAARLGIDLQISILTAVGDYDADAGATVVIPGSHLWPLDQPVDRADARPVELEEGSSLLYLGSVVHGGGRNVTADRWRKGIYVSYLLGWLTPEEAVAMSLTPERADALPQRARELLGWSSLHGSTKSEGAEGALQLWQLDEQDLERMDGLFTHR